MKCFGMKLLLASLALFVTLGSLGSDRAAAATLAPFYTSGNDGIVYQFLPNAPISGGFPTLLLSGSTVDGHDTQSLMKFDLSSAGIGAGAVDTATLHLYVISTAAVNFGANPSPSSAIDVSTARLATSPTWAPNTITWSGTPSPGGVHIPVGAEDTTTVNGINQWITLDVTDMVKDWLTTPGDNNGLLLFQSSAPIGSGTSSVAATYDGSDAGATRAYLEINTLEAEAAPEPAALSSALVAVIFGGGLLAWRKRRTATLA